MFDLPPPDPSLQIELASTGISKGLAQTDGPQLEATGALGFGDFSIESYVKNVGTSGDDGAEIGLFLGAETENGGFDLSLEAGVKTLVSIASSDRSAIELRAEAGRSTGPFAGRATIIFSPDDTGGTREALFAEFGIGWRVAPATRVSAAVGLREREGSPDYTAFNAGVSHALADRLQVDVRYFDTAESALGEVFRDRLVASLRLRF